MPTYEYACKSCGQHLEVVQSFKDDSLTTCPACSGPLRKVFGSIGIAFKGSGFYKTDSRPAGKGDGGSDKGAAKPDTGTKTDTGTKKADSGGTKADSSSSGSSSSGSSGAKSEAKSA